MSSLRIIFYVTRTVLITTLQKGTNHRLVIEEIKKKKKELVYHKITMTQSFQNASKVCF